MLLPKAISYYRSYKSNAKRTERPIKPVPPAVSRALGILFVVAVIALIATFPSFATENIFTRTQSRIQIPVDVLFTRLNALRPLGLSTADNQLRQKLQSLEGKLLYFKFGPDALSNCLFCNLEDHKSYMYYSLPSLLAPHLFNTAVLALVTSGLFVGPEGAVWRRFATLSAIVLAGIDVWSFAQYDYTQNAKALRLEDLSMFFWNSRMWRCVGIAALDAVLGWLMWLSSTNRAFFVPISASERLETSLKGLESVRGRLTATSIVKNTTSRDEGLRNRANAYWVHEGQLMREGMEDPEVMESVNNALQNRVNVDRISADAENYATTMLGEIHFLGLEKSKQAKKTE